MNNVSSQEPEDDEEGDEEEEGEEEEEEGAEEEQQPDEADAPDASSLFYNTTFSAYRVSPLHVGREALDAAYFETLSKRLRATLVGDVVRGVQVGLASDDGALGRAGVLESVEWGWVALADLLAVDNNDDDASDGRGVDRHLFGLKKLLAPGQELPAIYKDPAYTYSSSWFLSTSQLSSEFFNGYGWSQVIDDGFGIAYMINEER